MLTLPIGIETALSVPEQEALRDIGTGRVLEMGAWVGASTVLLAHGANIVYSVDWHQGDKQAGFRPTLQEWLITIAHYGVGHKVNALIGRFEEILPALVGAMFDVVFVDGLHDLEAVKADALQALRLVKPGGTVAFHDYGRYEVKDALDQVIGESPDRLIDSLAVYSVD